jgi:hypothetical protein
MDSFYLIVLAVATLVLILMLAFLGWNMSNAKKGTRFPTITTSCPDNWKSEKITVNGADIIACKRPENFNKGNEKLDTYMTSATSIGYINADKTEYLNFADNLWNKDVKIPKPTCAKKEWAKTNGVVWDSVDNANYC